MAMMTPRGRRRRADELEDDEFAAVEYADRVPTTSSPATSSPCLHPAKAAAEHYILEAESIAYEMSAEDDTDWGRLPGTRVVGVLQPVRRRRAAGTHLRRQGKVKVPTHLLLLAGFDVDSRWRRRWPEKAAMKVVLSAAVRDDPTKSAPSAHSTSRGAASERR